MLSCHGCKRFLREDSQGCPFCGAVRVTAFAPVAIVVALGVAIAACGPSVIGGDGGSTSEGDATSASSTVSITVSSSADDGPVTAPGTNNTTAPDPTTASITDTATATETTTTDGDDDVVDDEGCAFYGGCPTDWGTVAIECDIWAQDCPEGEKCMPWANDGGVHWNATRCTPLDPSPPGIGEPCVVEGSGTSGIDQCDVGAMCWNVDPLTNEGTCAAMCSGSLANPSCPGDGTQCMIAYDGVVVLCLDTCDPLLQDCVAIAECVPVDDQFFCVPDQSGAAGLPGDGCHEIDLCDPGLFCAVPEAVPGCADLGCCAEFCDLALPDPDTQCSSNADGVQCLPWYDEGAAPAGYELLGACVLPS
jgi:hypothetical protein